MLIDRNKFWAWAYSDFLSNANRGFLAEYIVDTAINSNTEKRTEWDGCDLVPQDRLKIEVKGSLLTNKISVFYVNKGIIDKKDSAWLF